MHFWQYIGELFLEKGTYYFTFSSSAYAFLSNQILIMKDIASLLRKKQTFEILSKMSIKRLFCKNVAALKY